MCRRLLGVLLGAAMTATLAAQLPRELFERARLLEESNNKLPDAIVLYTQVASQSTDRQLVATAQLRIGLLHERLGHKEEAQRAFRTVVEHYGDQAEVARQAQARLAPVAPAASNAPAARRLWAGAGVDLSGAPSPDGKYVSYVDWETGDLAVRDLATGARRRLTGNPRFMQAAAFAQESSFSPDGKQIAYVWFHDEGMDLRVIGVAGGSPRVLVNGADMPMLRVSWGGDPLHVAVSHQAAGRTHRLAIVNVATGVLRPLKSFDWREPARIALSPDGRYLAYDFPPREDAPNRDIYVLAVDGSREAIAVQHAGNDLFPVWTPDGGHLVFLSDRTGAPALWTVAMEAGRPRAPARLLQPTGNVRPLGFTRAGALVYGLGTGSMDVFVAAIDVATGKLLETPRVAPRQVSGVNSRPRWSPDGRVLAYQADRVPGGGLGARRLILQTVSTGDERDLNVPLPYFQRAEWLPDGRAVLLQARSPRGARGFFKVDAASGDTTLAIPRQERQGYAPAWIDGGRAIIFSSTTDAGERVLLRHDLSTGADDVLYRVPPGRTAGDSSISPDGKWLAFREGNAPTSINIMPAEGGDIRELVRVEEPDSIPGFGGLNWTPDGRHLLFVRSTGALNEDRTVWKVPVAGGPAEKTELRASRLRDLHLHPDGRRVAFTAGEGSDEVWVLDRLLPLNGFAQITATRKQGINR